MGIAYAAVTNIQFSVTGNATVAPSADNFKVVFGKVGTADAPTFEAGAGTSAGVNVEFTTPTERAATLDVTGLKKVGDTVTAIFKVINESTDLDATLTDLNTTGTNNYFTVTAKAKENIIPALEKTDIEVTVTLKKLPVASNAVANVSVNFSAAPTEIGSVNGGTGGTGGEGGSGGDVGGVTETDLELMQRYVLGTQLAGRSVLEIANIDMANMKVTSFIGDSESITDANSKITIVLNVYSEDMYTGAVVVQYNNKMYKIKINATTYITQSVEILETVGREGQTVKYDSNNDGTKEDWIILTDRDGLVEIVSAAPMGSLTLGSGDTTVNVTTDIDGDGTVGNAQDIAILSYNNAITTINNYCKSLVTATDNEGVRSIGASSDTSGNYSSEDFNSWFKNSSTVSVKAGDEYFKTDFERMSVLGIVSANEKYWMASRVIGFSANEATESIYFLVKLILEDGSLSNRHMWIVESNGTLHSATTNNIGVRPVIINPSGI